tara:strand:+ start:565 stop:1938 length:1374 start_codon:yes stop_codon:yes gene_type:complete
MDNTETTDNTETENQSNKIDIQNLIDFSKIIKDLLNDLNNTFNDKVESIINNDIDLKTIINYELPDNQEYDEKFISCVENIFNYCKSVYPVNFFNILYQNQDMFKDDSNTEFLPNIQFSELFFDTTSDNTKETLWKYLQLILFSIITNIEDKESFGNNEKLFEAINSDEFKNKLEETVKNMEGLFNFNNTSDENSGDVSNSDPFNFNKVFESMNIDPSNVGNLPDTDTIHDHINKLINGKLGSLAKELAEETTKDLGLDVENITDVNDLFKKLFQNPNKLMSLVTNISGKLDKKMKDGSIKESEILEEASSIFKNMKGMPGMDNIQDLFKSMNLDQMLPKGGKINSNAFQHMMDQNIKMSKMRERMKKKAEDNSQQKQQQQQEQPSTSQESDMNLNPNNLNELNSNLMSLMEQMKGVDSNSFIGDILKQQLQQQQKPQQRSTNTNKQRKKKKHNRKK